MGVAVFLVEWPSDPLVKLLEWDLSGLGDVAHNRVNRLALVVSLFTLDNIFGGDTTLRQIDVSCINRESAIWTSNELNINHTLLLVDTQNNNNLVAANTDQLLNTANTSSRKFGKQNHAVDVVVFQQLDVGAHLGDLFMGKLYE